MVTPKSSGKRRFADFVANQSDDIPELPLIHSTRCERVFDIAKNNHLDPCPCPVFGKPLVYLFYGRPAYQSKLGGRPTTEIRFFPVCFVFKPYLRWPRPAGILPFDSGAAATGKLKPHVPSKKFADFGLKASISSAKRIVKQFFETNEAYYSANARPGLVLPASEQEAQSYYDLIRSRGETAHDDRRSSIEFRFQDEINLRDQLLTVILPSAFLQVPEISKAIYQDWRVYPLPYPTYDGAIPSTFKAVIFTQLKRYLAEGGYL